MVSGFESTLSSAVDIGLHDPLLPFLQSGSAEEHSVAESLASHKDELSASDLDLTRERDVQRCHVILCGIAEVFLDAVHALPFGRSGDELPLAA